MRVAVSSSGRELDAPIDPRFGRCAYFIIVNTDDMSFDVYANESSTLDGGAGIQSAQFVASKGAEAVLTGNVGPNAVSALSAAGVQLVTGLTGNVRQSVDDYKRGRLKSSAESNVSGNYGMSGGVGMRRGMGQGRGMGGGMGTGRGMGRGGRRGGGMRNERQIR